MKNISISYNPYTVRTKFKVNGNDLAQNSQIRTYIDGESPQRLQEWVEFLPQILKDELNDIDFKINFHGTQLDFEDLEETFEDYKAKRQMNVELEHIPAKETADKEALIDKIFEKITSKDCPIKGLDDPSIIEAFNNAKKNEFEVCVVATMSSGKSTLINAMLGTKLMPSKQEACTAIITRIKDTNEDRFSAEVYNKDDDEPAATYRNVNYDIMKRLNDDPEVSVINMEGNIPFLSADEMSLVLIDTPGPNNARDSSHGAKQREFLGKNSKALVLYIMTGEFGTNDDNELLHRIAESMSVGGKKSRDRFIFVVNKMDNHKAEDGKVEDVLGKIRDYLANHGIANAHLFPVAALPAMDIRRMQSGELTDEDEIDDVKTKIRRLNRNELFHFESYAMRPPSMLPPSIRGDIISRLERAEANWQDDPKNNPDTALIHSGVVSIEAAICQYVQKYAKTAKIKNIVDTFMHHLDDARYLEGLTKDIASNEEEKERIVQQILNIETQLDSAEEARKFNGIVDNRVKEVNEEFAERAFSICTEFNAQRRQRAENFRGRELEKYEVDNIVNNLKIFAKDLESQFKYALDQLIEEKLVQTGKGLLADYKKRLERLNDNSLGIADIKLDKFVGGNLGNLGNFDSVNIRNFVATKQVADGEEWIKNTNKKWWKPWTWGEESGYYRTKYKDVEYIKGYELAQHYLTPIEASLYEQAKAAEKYAEVQSERIAEIFKNEFECLDNVIKDKLHDLKCCAANKDKAEQSIKDSEFKLKWLDKIIEEVNSILEI